MYRNAWHAGARQCQGLSLNIFGGYHPSRARAFRDDGVLQGVDVEEQLLVRGLELAVLLRANRRSLAAQLGCVARQNRGARKRKMVTGTQYIFKYWALVIKIQICWLTIIVMVLSNWNM